MAKKTEQNEVRERASDEQTEKFLRTWIPKHAGGSPKLAVLDLRASGKGCSLERMIETWTAVTGKAHPNPTTRKWGNDQARGKGGKIKASPKAAAKPAKKMSGQERQAAAKKEITAAIEATPKGTLAKTRKPAKGKALAAQEAADRADLKAAPKGKAQAVKTEEKAVALGAPKAKGNGHAKAEAPAPARKHPAEALSPEAEAKQVKAWVAAHPGAKVSELLREFRGQVSTKRALEYLAAAKAVASAKVSAPAAASGRRVRS